MKADYNYLHPLHLNFDRYRCLIGHDDDTTFPYSYKLYKDLL